MEDLPMDYTIPSSEDSSILSDIADTGWTLDLETLNPFSKLPTEIIQYIAYLLPDNTDLSSFISTCTFLAERVFPSHSSIWRKRFKDRYDMPYERSSTEIKIEYKTRAIVLPQKISFKLGEKEAQTLWLEVVKTLLLESFCSSSHTSSTPPASKNLDRIREVLSDSDFMKRPVSGYSSRRAKRSPSNLFCAVQLCLTYLCLDLSMSYRCLRTDYDIGSVYSYGLTSSQPLVPIGKLDLEKLLHIRNFWQRHLTNPDEGTFYSSFESLPESRRPKPWECALGTRTELRTLWLGYYSCIHPYPKTLSSLEDRQTCGDLDSHWTHTLRLSLHLIPDSNPLNWPTAFDIIIPILDTESTRTYFRGVQRFHQMTDSSSFLVRGFTEPTSSSHADIPGWTRICFVIYDADREFLKLISQDDEQEEKEEARDKKEEQELGWLPEEEWPPVDLELEFNWIFGYEGVMLPGGRIMMGRWIDMREPSITGPFIFWDT